MNLHPQNFNQRHESPDRDAYNISLLFRPSLDYNRKSLNFLWLERNWSFWLDEYGMEKKMISVSLLPVLCHYYSGDKSHGERKQVQTRPGKSNLFFVLFCFMAAIYLFICLFFKMSASLRNIHFDRSAFKILDFHKLFSLS